MLLKIEKNTSFLILKDDNILNNRVKCVIFGLIVTVQVNWLSKKHIQITDFMLVS